MENPREPTQINEPVHHDHLYFSGCWTGGPQHALHTEACTNKLTEHRRQRRIGWEVGKEVRRLPVSESRSDDRPQIIDQTRQVFAVFRRRWVQLSSDVAGSHL